MIIIKGIDTAVSQNTFMYCGTLNLTCFILQHDWLRPVHFRERIIVPIHGQYHFKNRPRRCLNTPVYVPFKYQSAIAPMFELQSAAEPGRGKSFSTCQDGNELVRL